MYSPLSRYISGKLCRNFLAPIQTDPRSKPCSSESPSHTRMKQMLCVLHIVPVSLEWPSDAIRLGGKVMETRSMTWRGSASVLPIHMDPRPKRALIAQCLRGDPVGLWERSVLLLALLCTLRSALNQHVVCRFSKRSPVRIPCRHTLSKIRYTLSHRARFIYFFPPTKPYNMTLLKHWIVGIKCVSAEPTDFGSVPHLWAAERGLGEEGILSCAVTDRYSETLPMYVCF